MKWDKKKGKYINSKSTDKNILFQKVVPEFLLLLDLVNLMNGRNKEILNLLKLLLLKMIEMVQIKTLNINNRKVLNYLINTEMIIINKRRRLKRLSSQVFLLKGIMEKVMFIKKSNQLNKLEKKDYLKRKEELKMLDQVRKDKLLLLRLIHIYTIHIILFIFLSLSLSLLIIIIIIIINICDHLLYYKDGNHLFLFCIHLYLYLYKMVPVVGLSLDQLEYLVFLVVFLDHHQQLVVGGLTELAYFQHHHLVKHFPAAAPP